ncbi:MAG: hypothetical protein WD896_00240 [Parcubacteria group bacterium]
MKKSFSPSLEAGNGTMEGIIILAVLIIIMISTYGNPPPDRATGPSDNTLYLSGNTSATGENIGTPTSSYARNISLSTGNAPYAYQPFEEYITIDNRGQDPVDITGWRLENGKDKRGYDLGSGLRYFAADAATIGQAAPFISPLGLNYFQNIVLKDGETAIITTGSIGSRSPYNIVSFKENICSGYLEDRPEYTFTPPLTRNCPRPANEPGVAALDTECRRFIERMASCRVPEFDTRDTEGEICRNCVDGQPLSGSCVAFIKSRFNYGSCIANHSSDANFSGRTWRVFLGRGWEMWAKEYETIELFDRLGRLVDEESY